MFNQQYVQTQHSLTHFAIFENDEAKTADFVEHQLASNSWKISKISNKSQLIQVLFIDNILIFNF